MLYRILLNTKLTYAILFGILIGLFIPVTVSGYIIIQSEIQSLKKEIEHFKESTAKIIADSIKSSMWDVRVDVAKEILGSIANDKRVVSVSIFDRASNTIFLEFHDEARSVGNILATTMPIINEGINIGDVTLRVSDSMHQKELESQIKAYTMVLAIQLLSTLALIIPLIYLKVILPLKRLKGQAIELSSNRLKSEFIWNQNDEIGVLGQSFEGARVSIKTLLDEQKSNLEKLQKNIDDLNIAHKELTRAQEKLIEQEKLASLGVLVAGISHEINTPIGVCVTAASRVSSDTKALHDKVEQGLADNKTILNFLQNMHVGETLILSNLKRASELIKSFKAISADQAGELERTINLKEYLQQTIFSLEYQLKNKYKVTLDVSDYIVLKCRPGSLSQIFTNLIMNSINHGFASKKGGEIAISAFIKEDVVHMTYKDSGSGIPDAITKRVFEPFFTTDRQRGTGLGLPIIYNIVTKNLNGTIGIDSHYKDGAKFDISFPLKQ